jgi:hypothetical protein
VVVSFYPSAPAQRILVAVLIALALAPGAAAKSADISGVIFTLDTNHLQTVWPNARVTLNNLATKIEVSTVSSDLGAYTFAGVLYGEYEITVALAGFDQVTKHITIKSDVAAKLDFQLTLKEQTQNITAPAGLPRSRRQR